MSGRKIKGKKKENPSRKELTIEPSDEDDAQYAYIGTFSPNDTDKLLNSFKQNNIRCSVELLDKLKTVLRSYGWSQSEFEVYVHPESVQRAMKLRDSLISWEMRLNNSKN